MGSVKINRIGLITALTIPKTSAATRAAVKFATWIPGKRYAAAKITIAERTKFIKIDITTYIGNFAKR